MVEITRHALGLCGEHSHPSLLTLLLGAGSGLSVYQYIKYKYFTKNK